MLDSVKKFITQYKRKWKVEQSAEYPTRSSTKVSKINWNQKAMVMAMLSLVLFLILPNFANAESATSNSKGPSPEMMEAMKKASQATSMQSDGLTTSERISKYVKSGFVHIIPLGLDHILFVLALFLSTTRFGTLLWQVTAFTLAHSVTLALSSLGIISLSGSIVEPLIALSIVWMAIENIRSEEAGQRRIWVIVIFGLLHGLGFASVLGEFGLPQEAFLMALFSFNVGVELGQLTVLAIAAALLMAWSKKPTYRMFVQVPLSAIIGVIGVYWFVERVFG